MSNFIVVGYPDDYDTWVQEFETLSEALEQYDEVRHYANPILAQVLEVKVLTQDINGNKTELKV